MTLRLSRLLLALALIVLAAPLFISPAANTAAAAATAGSAKTVEGTWHPWKPNAEVDNESIPGFPLLTGKVDTSKTPSVTVSKTKDLGDEVVTVSWKNFTPSSNEFVYYADPDTGTPTPRPYRADPGDSALYGVSVYQCRGTRPTVNPNPQLSKNLDTRAQCYDAPITLPTDGAYGPNNTVSAVTQNDGTGSVAFHVENSVTNDLLRCSPRQPCSIVVVPNQGGRVRGTADPSTADCEIHDDDFVGAPEFNDILQAGIKGDRSPCSWSKRITVPLTFAPVADGCPDSTSSFNAAGSPPLRKVLSQLLAGWCRGSKPVNFDYNFTSTESEARSRFLFNVSTGLTSDTDVALTTQPADPGLQGVRPFVYAPVANNAVAVPYVIDNAKTGRPITDLRLTARLVAKLLTQSYAPASWNCPLQEAQAGKAPWCAADIRFNPMTIFDDPEFQRLNFRGDHPDRDSFPSATGSNPSIGSQQNLGSFFPTIAAGDSDLTYQLTRWIASDDDASEFMQGKADQWHMRINPNYRVTGGSLYPTTHIDALEPGYVAPNVPQNGEGIDLRTKQGFQGSWTPVGSPSQVAATLIRNRSTAYNVNGECPAVQTLLCDSLKKTPTITVRFPKSNSEYVGTRSLTAVTDNVDAQVYGLPTARLATAKGDFVGPDRGSLATAASALDDNRDGTTQSLNFRTAPADAYPLLLPVYAMVPTCGLTAAKATGIKRMLGRITTSQRYGDVPGTLARGTVKLTAAQLADTRQAATRVSTKRCPTPPASNVDNDAANRDSGNNGGGGNSGGGGGGTAPQAPASAPPAAPGANVPQPRSGSSSPAAATNVGYRLDDNGGGLALLPILLLVGGVLLIGGPAAWWAMATAPGRTARDRLRHLIVGTPWGRR